MTAGIMRDHHVLISLGLAACAFAFTTSWISTAIPENAATIPKLIDHLSRPIPRHEIAARVKKIVIDQLGLPETAYDENKRFVEDFGAG